MGKKLMTNGLSEMLKGKWQKVGQSKSVFFQPWICPQDIQGILTSVKKLKDGKFKSVEGTIQQTNGTPIKIKGGEKSQMADFYLNQAIGGKVRMLYTGGNTEEGKVVSKTLPNISTYKQFAKWKGKKVKFYQDWEFFNLAK